MKSNFKRNLIDMRNKDIKELRDLIVEFRKKIVEVSQSVVNGSEKDLKKVSVLRKDLARVKTVANEKILLESNKIN